MAVSTPVIQDQQETTEPREELPWPHLEAYFTTVRAKEEKGVHAYMATCS